MSPTPLLFFSCNETGEVSQLLTLIFHENFPFSYGQTSRGFGGAGSLIRLYILWTNVLLPHCHLHHYCFDSIALSLALASHCLQNSMSKLSDWVQLFGGAGLGIVGEEVVSLIKLMYHKYYSAVNMKEVLEDVIPILDDLDLDFSNEECLPQSCAKKIQDFRQKLNDARQRIANSSPRSLEGLTGGLWGMSDLEDYVNSFSKKFGWIIVMSEMRNMRKLMRDRETSSMQRGRGRGRDAPSLQTLQLPTHQVGLDVRVKELKEMLFKDSVKKVGVTAMGGSGKTTLAAALLNDYDVKDHFVGGIIFETVSQNVTSIKKILESMWKKISKSKQHQKFRNVEDARIQIQELLQRISQPTLVVLDDVWSENDLEQLLLEAPKYKTVVTTRFKLNTCFDSCYDLRLLEEEDALSLFCFWAFEVDRIPETGYDKSLVKQVAQECKGLPLALKVVGTCLNHQAEVIWINAQKQLSKAAPISDEHEQGLLERIEISYTGIKDEVQRQCFLDLGLFPEEKKIPVDSLFDIWIHVRNLEWNQAFQILVELEKRNLLDLVNDLGNHPGTSYGSTCDLYVVQHDVLRDLAIYLASHKHPENAPKRLIMPSMEDCIPKSWEEHSYQQLAAEIISIHTGSMTEKQWPTMKFPKTQVLVLIFTGNEYFLPPFLQTMAELKVLIIINQNSIDTKLKGMSAFTSLAKLKSIRLERLTVPSIERYSQYLTNLKKLSLSLCKGDDESNHGLDLEVCSKLPGLEEISIDHCSDIKELPASVCNLTSLKNVSITNCHCLNKLPEDLGKLAGSLVMLMLGASPALEALPDSICELGKLKFLDISECGCIRTLPNEFGKLQSLKALDIRETCLKVKKLPQSAAKLKSLSRVICDEKNGYLWTNIKDFIPNLQVEIAEHSPNLEWLEI